MGIGRDLNILIVEDDENDVMLLNRAFRKTDTQPMVILRDGEEAVEYLKGAGAYSDRAKYPFPDLIITDIKMPKRSGIELARWMSTHAECAVVPLIVLSASAEPSDIQEVYRLRVSGYFQKPLHLGDLTELIKTIVTYWRLALHPNAPKECL